MSSVKIRNMSIEDLPTVFKIGVNEFNMTKIYHQFWNLIELATHLEKEKELCIIAELDGHVVGFALGRERYSSWERDLGYLEWIAVSKEYQNKGIGSALCNEMIKRFKKLGVKKILADVETKQFISKNLLEKFSFKEIFCVDWFIKEI